MRALAAGAALLVLTPGAVSAGGDSVGTAPRARTESGTPDSGGRELSYVDVSSDDDRSRGAVATRTPADRGSTDYRQSDPLPVIRWATRGEWRRHRSVPPAGSAVTPRV